MRWQFIKFIINGCMIAFLGWALQQLIYYSFGNASSYTYALASTLTLIPLVCINFIIQRRWVFNHTGCFTRFLLSDLLIILLVTALAPVFRDMLNWLVGPPSGDLWGFISAAMFASLPSFLIRRYWVFSIAPSSS